MDKISDINVSLIIPVYNVEHYIEKCLCSALGQTLDNIEIIVVNDGATDESMKIVDIFENKYPNIRIINKKNGGLSSARNSGLEFAKGKYIAFLDSDDYIEETMLEQMYTSAENRELDIVGCNLTKVDEQGNNLGQEKNMVDYNHIYDRAEATSEYLLNNIPAYAWNKLYRRSLFQDNNITYPVGKLYEDIGTTFQLISVAERIGFIEEALYLYVQRDGAITKVPSFKAGKDIISTIDGIKNSLVVRELNYKYEEVYQCFLLKYLFLASVLFYKRYAITRKIEKHSLFSEANYNSQLTSYEELESFRELASIKISEINSKLILRSKYLNAADKLKYVLLKTGFIYLAVTIRESLLGAKNKLCMKG